jgi:hypothetical protein
MKYLICAWLWVMAVIESIRNLSYDFPEQFLLNENLFPFTLGDHGFHVAINAEFHENVDLLICLINDSINVFDDVLMFHLSKNVDFID